MKTALRTLLTMTMLGGGLFSSGGIAHADGPYGEPTYQDPSYGQDPNAPQYGQPGAYGTGDPNDPNGQAYQPPPEGTCIDDNNQSYDCSSDSDYSTYSQIDDGYDPTAYQDFQSTLASHGNWVNSPEYGQVWIPSQNAVGADFTPYYSGGHWTMTDYGWTWVSDYSWGWAPFHYGRWNRIGNYGWGWIPGRIWGPAWVHWRLGGGYVGWAPLPPRGVRIAPPIYAGRSHFWNFVPMGQITAPRLVRVAPSLTVGLWGRTSMASDLRAIGSTRIVYGPAVSHFAGASIRIQPAPLATVHMAMPRSSIVVRAGVPLASRPYYAPAYRANWNGGGRTFSNPPSRPGYPGGYQPSPGPRPGTPGGYQPAPGPRPGVPGGYQPAPGPRPGVPGGYQPAPGPRPGAPGGYQPSPAPHPGYPGGYQPTPGPRPGAPGGYQPSPAPHPGNPGGYQPAPGRPTAPGGFQPAPAPSGPRPGYQPPVYHAPSPSYQPVPAPRPTPAFQPAPRPTPAFQPAPRPMPAFQPPPRPMPSPSYQPPSRPMPSPSYQPPSRPSPSPSYQPPSRPSAPPTFHAPSRPSSPSPSNHFSAPPPRR